jgi:hypothetical protein
MARPGQSSGRSVTRAAPKVGPPAPARLRSRPSEPARPVRRRPTLALALALGAVLLAVVGAIGRDARARATYEWPPPKLPESATPTRLWYSPLLLTRGIAAEISATFPCRSLAPPLDRAARSTTLLATMRHPVSGRGLSLVRTGDRVSVRFGDVTAAEGSMRSPPGGCRDLALGLQFGRWELRLPSGQVKYGHYREPPNVTGLFSGLDLRSGAQPRVAVTTLPYGALVSWWQWAAWAGAVALALGALVAAFGYTRSRARPLRQGLTATGRRVLARLRPVDGVVTVLLLAWWVIGPAFYDDGWVKARQTNGDAGGFSNYYTTFGSNLPLDYWSEWLQHWVVAHTDVLLVMRVPTLVLLGAVWILCRSILRSILGETRSAGAEWALSLAFLLNAFAWGMTLRPEPIVAVLLVSVLALAIRFVERPSGWLLAVGGGLVALAVTAHPAGLITLAPLLAIGPHLVTWVRTSGWLPPAVLLSTVSALLIVIVTVGSNAHQRGAESRLIRTYGDATASWRDELTRYFFVGAEATVIRRASVALMLVAVAGYLARRRVASRRDLPGTTLLIALILLIPTPSKWSWHFGALIGLAALAVAAEVARFRAEEESLRWPVRPLVAYGAAVLVVCWALFPRADWSTEFGLRTLDWTLGFESRVTLVRLALIAFVLAFAAVVVVTLLVRGRTAAWRVPWRLVPWLVPAVVLPLVAWTIGMLVADAVKTPAWTLTRQNVESFAGRQGCGLADDTIVAAPESIRTLTPLPGTSPAPPPRWLQDIRTPNPLRFGLFTGNSETRLALPWFPAPTDERVGFYVFSGLQGGDGVVTRWGDTNSRPVRTGPWTETHLPDLDNAHPEVVRWGFVPQGAMPVRPARANAAQLALESQARPPHALAATGAVTYRATTLASLFRESGARPLVWPNLLLYMPCTHLPRLAGGLAEVPTMVVAHSDLISVEREDAPFRGIVDLYSLRDLGTADSKVDPEGIGVYWVDRRIPGAAVAPAVPVGV